MYENTQSTLWVVCPYAGPRHQHTPFLPSFSSPLHSLVSAILNKIIYHSHPWCTSYSLLQHSSLQHIWQQSIFSQNMIYSVCISHIFLIRHLISFTLFSTFSFFTLSLQLTLFKFLHITFPIPPICQFSLSLKSMSHIHTMQLTISASWSFSFLVFYSSFLRATFSSYWMLLLQAILHQ